MEGFATRDSLRSEDRGGIRRLRVGGAAVALVCLAATGCAPGRPPPESAIRAPAPPLERICQEALPLAERTVGELVRLLQRTNPALILVARPCHVGTAWPIAFATGAADGPPIGFTILKMEGDALLTFDGRSSDAPTINLCQELGLRLDARHLVRVVALWPSSDEAAFDAEHPERATASVAWIELLSRTPSACALGRREEAGAIGDPELQCAARAGGSECAAASAPTASDALHVEERVAASHRFVADGRSQALEVPGGPSLRLERPERCVYEPPPAMRDVCLAEYLEADGSRWYGRGDVTRTGAAGEKNYVDSYLTFQLLRRIEAERKKANAPSRR